MRPESHTSKPAILRMDQSIKRLPARTLRYGVGRHTLYRGDCLKVLRSLPEGQIDVVVTSRLTTSG